MIIIIDSNILVSAIIKDGFTRELIVQCKEQLVAPEYLFQEIRNNEEEILLKSKLNIKDYRDLLKILLKYITIIPNEVIMSHREEAIKIIKDIDVYDALFIATALAFDNSVIWSNDKKLKMQSRVKIINTEEIIKLTFNN